jgi:para-aminobenzoate synthetase/4-amino-4-deoxychorismate lyase
MSGRCKIRLLMAADGSVEITSSPLQALPEPLRLQVGSMQVDPADPLLYLKTEHRDRYNWACQEQPGADEVLLCNNRGELTEGSFTNLVLKLDNRLVTPPLTSGLLPGIMRQELLEHGEITEQVLYPQDLQRAEEIWLINSVRGWLRAELVKGA